MCYLSLFISSVSQLLSVVVKFIIIEVMHKIPRVTTYWRRESVNMNKEKKNGHNTAKGWSIIL